MNSEEFEFLQMHFHWRGSEHQINGRKFAAELHLVHRSLSDPKIHAVIGFLFQVEYQVCLYSQIYLKFFTIVLFCVKKLVDNDNYNLKPIIENLRHIRNVHSTIKTENLEINVLVPFEVKDYYRYNGSLTTPGCDEVVNWIVTEKPIIGISEDQLLEFQSIRDKNGDEVRIM